MPLIPAWHIAVLALLYVAEYIYRAWRQQDKRYIYLGKAFGRLLLSGTYLYFSIAPPVAELRAPLVRWSLFVFLGIDLFYAILEHGLNYYKRRYG